MLNKELRTVIHKIVWVILFLSGFSTGNAAAEWAKVRQVIDGDTIILETNQHVRLIGVDTPEIKSKYNPRTEYFALQAKQFVEQRAEGRMVFLEGDDAQAPFDKYERSRRRKKGRACGVRRRSKDGDVRKTSYLQKTCN